MIKLLLIQKYQHSHKMLGLVKYDGDSESKRRIITHNGVHVYATDP